MGSNYSQPVLNQEQNSRALLRIVPEASLFLNQPLIPSVPSINMKNTRIQQRDARKGRKPRVILSINWLAKQSFSMQRLALSEYLPNGVSFTPHKANSSPMWNVQGSSKCPCLQHQGQPICSWLAVCKIVTGKRPGLCSFDGCSNKATCGGHVKYVNGRTWYLAPICSSCNNTNSDDIATPMKAGTIIVKIKCPCCK